MVWVDTVGKNITQMEQSFKIKFYKKTIKNIKDDNAAKNTRNIYKKIRQS